MYAPAPPGPPLRCTCGNLLVAPPGAPAVVCPYCHRQLAVTPVVSTPTETRRTWAAILIGAAILFMLVGTFTRAWLIMSEDDDSVRIGLLGGEQCERGRCDSFDYDDDRGRDSMLMILGIVGKVAVAGTLATCAILVWTGTRVITRKPAVGPATAGIVLASLAGVGASTWAYQIQEHIPRLSYGWGLLLYFAGAVCGVIGCVLTSRRARSQP